MSTISASTTSTTGFKVTSDTTGTLVFQTGASPTTAMTLGSDQSVTFAGAQTYTGAATFTTGITVQGLTVGKGAGAVSTNTAVGASALAGSNTGSGQNTGIGNLALNANTSGAYNSAVGSGALYSNTTGSNNVAVGQNALVLNTTASNNTAVGYQAGYSATTVGDSVYLGHTAGYAATGQYNVIIGKQAGYNATGNRNTFIGFDSGFSTTGSQNTFVGGANGSNEGAGYYVTTGSKNSILGNYNGNQGGLDIRTASNHIVLSDGDGNPRLGANSNGWFWANQGGSNTPYYTTNSHRFNSNSAQGDQIFTISCYPVLNEDSLRVYGVTTGGASSSGTALIVNKNGGTSRSINCAGTVNQNGADYAEYMTKCGDFAVAKGDVVGINAEGKITNVFVDAVSFCVKSTDPGLVGGDSWGTEEAIGMTRPEKPAEDATEEEKAQYETDKAVFDAALEEARQKVDRIAFCGQVPVNVTGATAGQYIIPVNDNGAIKGEAVSNPTFEQYQQAVGKVIAIEQDGRARIIVKVA